MAERYGYGSPLHIAARKLFPQSGVSATFPVTIYPLAVPTGAQAAMGEITLTVENNYEAAENSSGKFYIADTAVEFSVAKGDTVEDIKKSIVDAINGVLEMPVTATYTTPTETTANPPITLTSKWKGASANLITVDLPSDTMKIDGITFGKSDMGGGSKDPDVADALAKIGDVWETFIMDTFDWKDKDRLDAYQSFADERWNWLNKKGCLIAHGSTEDYATRTAVTDGRKEDKWNFLIQSTGSRALPWAICAKGLVSDIMTTADSNPALGYKGKLTGIHAAGADKQENYTVRNNAVAKGASTNVKSGDVAELCDIVTFYHPVAYGKFPPYRRVVNIVKLMNVVYNVRLIMEAEEYKEAPLCADEDVVTNPAAIQPKTVKASFFALADSLVEKAIITRSDYTKKNMTVKINSENPGRLDVTFPVKLSGNITISSSEIFFSFNRG